MHLRNLTHISLAKRAYPIPALACGIICAMFVSLVLTATPARAESDFLLSITNLELDRYITRTPSQTDAQLPVRKRRRGKQPTVRDFIARDLNPNRDFNYLWLRNYTEKKKLLDEDNLVSGTLHAAIRMFYGERKAGEFYFLIDDADIPRWGGFKYRLGMSTDQFRFKVRYYF
ncbi:MAG: hypothetical protein ACR2P1_12655 [Pseudomonadales bacterium]